MSDNDINKIAVYDDRVVQTRPAYQVQKGALSYTNTAFRAITQSTSQHTYNINVPSEQVFVDRAIDWTSTCFFKVTCTVTKADGSECTAGEKIGTIGREFALPAFPLHSLCNTLTATINDATTTVNLADNLYEIARLVDFKENRIQRTCPNMLDKYQNLTFATGTLNNVCSGYQDAVDYDIVPNGAFCDFHFTDETGKVLSGNGDYTSNGVKVSYVDGIPVTTDQGGGAGVATNYDLYFKFTSTEKIMLSPFIFNDIHENDTGLYSVQNIQFIMNIKSPYRLLRYANAQKDVLLKVANEASVQYFKGGFEESKMNVEFLTPPLSLSLPPRSIVPYFDYPRYLTPIQSTVSAGKTSTLQSNTIVLSSIPDMFIIYVKKDKYAINEGEFYLSPEKVNIQFDNFAGVLSSHTKEQLYRMSYANGLKMDYNAWRGLCNTSNGQVGLVGGFLVLKPGIDIPLQEGQASGMLGSFSFQCDVTVRNTSAVDVVNPNLYVLAVNSGFFESQNGSSRIIKNPLSESDIIQAPVGSMSTNSNLKRMVGSGFMSKLGSVLTTILKNSKPLQVAMKHVAEGGDPIQAVKEAGKHVFGRGQTGAGITGAGQTGAGKGKKKAILSRLM
jgi:hypothetical protein